MTRGLQRFDDGHSIVWQHAPPVRANVGAGGSLESLYVWGPGSDQDYLRVDSLTLGLNFVASDVGAEAVVLWYLGTSPTPSILLLTGMGGPIGQTLPNTFVQLQLPMIFMDTSSFVIRCDSAVTSLSSCSAVMSYSVGSADPT